MRDGRPNVCFVAPTAHAVLCGRSQTHFGGAQVQQVLIARELRRRNQNVSFVTFDEGGSGPSEVEGIRIFRMCGSGSGLPLVRFAHPRWTSLWKALSAADADVYYQRGGGAETGQIALWCGWRGRPFFFAAASDMDCDPALPHLPARHERMLFKYGLLRAARVIAQTRTQARSFLRHFGVEAAVVPSCGHDSLPQAGVEWDDRSDPPPTVLWVGRFHPWKRPEWLLDLAESMPDLVFDVVGPAPDNDGGRRVFNRAASMANVRVHGPVAHQEIGRFYRRAGLLLCTSPVEGYPNTFLEAWALGRPVVTTVDPDDVVATHRLGVVAHSVPALASGVRCLLTSCETWRSYARNARRFFLEHHTVRAAVDCLGGLITAAIEGRPRMCPGRMLEKCNG